MFVLSDGFKISLDRLFLRSVRNAIISIPLALIRSLSHIDEGERAGKFYMDRQLSSAKVGESPVIDIP